jgi:hypothetical protein
MFQPAALAAFLGAETVLGCAIRELVVGDFVPSGRAVEKFW